MFKLKIRELALNYTGGFLDTDVSFLRKLQFLLGLHLLSYWIPDVTPIESLVNLRWLQLYRTGKKGLNFALLTSLERLEMQWRPKSESLFDCHSLTKLTLNQYPGKETSAFCSLKALQKLDLAQGSVADLQGLRQLGSLVELRLSYLTKLQTLEGIENLSSLQVLRMETCKKISSIEQVSKLTNLRQIAFANCGDIESIEPLRYLKKLEIVHFYESTNVLDGDLSALTELPNLKDVRFMNRKHYSLRCEQFAPFGNNPEYPKQVNSGDR